MPEGPSANTFSPGPSYKLGALKKKCGGFKKWDLRYLILDKEQSILYYYHTPKDASPRRTLTLSQCTISRCSNDEGMGSTGFKVSLTGSRDFIFVGTNSAIVDDWVTAIAQAKQPQHQQQMGAQTQQMSGSQQQQQQQFAPGPGQPGPEGGPGFSYNGPTLAVLPARNAGGPQQQQPPQLARNPTNTQPSNRSTASTVTQDAAGNQTTLVGNPKEGGDTNSTLVAGGPPTGRQKIAPGQLVPVITMTPDNKKFAPIERVVYSILKIGRFVGNQPQSDDMITFKSKVISRNHAEIWSVNTEIYIRDTRSQSGTFLNAMRLSEPSKESKPYRLKPGDVIQFGVDYKGATEDNARCISVRVDLKTKVMEGAPPATGMRQPGEDGREETLVGGEGTTLVGGTRGSTKTSTNDRTLVGNGKPEEGTLYGDQNNQRPPMPGNMGNNQMGRPTMGGFQGGPPMGMMGRPPMGMMGNTPMMSPMGQQMGGPGMGRPPMGMMGRPPMGQPGMR